MIEAVNHYALVIGINRYVSLPDENQLVSPVEGANQFANWLHDEAGLPTENIKMVTTPETRADPETPYPVRESAILALKELTRKALKFDRRQWEGSRLYVYAAGHGVVPDGGRCALLFADYEADYVEHFDLQVCETTFEKHPYFHEVVVIGDCCRELAPGGLPRATELPFLLKSDGRITVRMLALGASHGQEGRGPRGVTPEPPYFTKVLLEGLRGQGGTVDPNDGTVTPEALRKYVQTRLPELSSQEPEISNPKFGAPVLIVHQHANQLPNNVRAEMLKFSVDIVFPSGHQWPRDTRLCLTDPDQTEVARWNGELVWGVQLPIGVYKIVPDQYFINPLFEVVQIASGDRRHELYAL